MWTATFHFVRKISTRCRRGDDDRSMKNSSNGNKWSTPIHCPMIRGGRNGMRIEEKFGIISSAMDEIERILLKKRKKKEPLRYVFYFLPPLCWNGGSCQRSVHLSNYRSLGASQLGSTMSIKREIRYNCSTFATVYALQSSTFLNRMAVCFTHEML